MTISLKLKAQDDAFCKVLNRAIQEYHYSLNSAKCYRTVLQYTYIEQRSLIEVLLGRKKSIKI